MAEAASGLAGWCVFCHLQESLQAPGSPAPGRSPSSPQPFGTDVSKNHPKHKSHTQPQLPEPPPALRGSLARSGAVLALPPLSLEDSGRFPGGRSLREENLVWEHLLQLCGQRRVFFIKARQERFLQAGKQRANSSMNGPAKGTEETAWNELQRP